MTDELDQVCEDFEAFREECVNLAILINTFTGLFGEKDPRGDYIKVAPQFFRDLNGWLGELYYLKVFRILDKSRAFKRENLTANLLVDRLKALSKSTSEIEELLSRLNCYKGIIEFARHRVVAHADRNAIMNAEKLGGHTEECAMLFRTDLQRFCDAVARCIGMPPAEFINIPPGDVADMQRVLRACVREKENEADND